MEDDVRQSGQERYVVSQAYRWRAERDTARQELEKAKSKVHCVAEVKIDGERLEELVHDAAVELTGIDRDALLALAKEMEEFGNLPVKHPGVRVLHNDDFSRELGYARRIREALGVES